MTQKTLSIILALYLFLSACEQVININIPQSEKKIVINSIFSSDSLMQVNISESQYILSRDVGPVFLNKANVEILENGTNFDILTNIGNGNYKSNKSPQTGNRYTIKVSSDNLPSAEATTYIPDKPNLISIDTLPIKNYDNIEVDIKFIDPLNMNNFYMVNSFLIDKMIEYDNEGNPTGVEISTKLPIYINIKDDEIFDDENIEEGILFTDKEFDGEQKQIRIDLDLFSISTTPNNTSYIEINLHSIPLELYLYIKSKEQQKYTINNPFVEPVQVLNNIENGLGIFSGISFSNRIFEIK